MPESVRIWGPGSLSNLGPGFDTLGVAISAVGDVVEVTASDRPGVRVLPGGGVWEAPLDVAKNTAGRAAAHVLAAYGGKYPGLEVRVVKGLRPGSGLGSSAASAAAAALGALRILTDLDREAAVQAALDGESVVSGAVHGDNVLPSLLGGAVLTAATDPERFRRLEIPTPIHFAVVRPNVEVLTREARAMLPKVVPLQDAVHNASSLAFLVDALRSGDIEAFGACIMLDRLVEPVRSRLVPGYASIIEAATEAGALGAALTGSGPSMFAVATDTAHAAEVASAMADAVRKAGPSVVSFTTTIDTEGARETDLARPETIV